LQWLASYAFPGRVLEGVLESTLDASQLAWPIVLQAHVIRIKD
jgi:hypothetical protein